MTSTQSRPAYPAADRVQRGVNAMNKVYTRPCQCKDKTQLRLSIGDPTFDGNLVTSAEATKALTSHTHTPTVFGYQRSWGRPEACAAVATYWAERFAGANGAACKAENVVLACGGSEAILLTINALCNPGDNILLPSPGFPQYSFVCDTFDFERRHYKLDPSKNWEVNVDEIRALVDDKTRAILLNNPSNPCGSNWRRAHVQEIIKVAEELKLPIISDELYAGMVFSGEHFVSVAEFTSPVPRFVIGGTAKGFIAPGWRFGWSLLIDPEGIAAGVLEGMHNLSMMALGPNAVTQYAAPQILKTAPEYFKKNMEEVERNALYFSKSLERCPGLSCAKPQGALYIMVKVHLETFKDFKDDVDFYCALEDEENIQVIPGTYLMMPGYFRVCITRPAHIIEEVMQRLPAFCERHRKE